jgi:hypothetical protein
MTSWTTALLVPLFAKVSGRAFKRADERLKRLSFVELEELSLRLLDQKTLEEMFTI